MQKVPRQGRSITMVHAILDAAVIVMLEGDGELSANRVAKEAGVSPGTLYQYFAGKDMILVAVAERFMLELSLSMDDAIGAQAPFNAEQWYDFMKRVLHVGFSLGPVFRHGAETLSASAWHAIYSIAVNTIEEALTHYVEKNSTVVATRPTVAERMIAINGLLMGGLQWVTEQPRDVDLDAFAQATANILDNLFDTRDSGDS